MRPLPLETQRTHCLVRPLAFRDAADALAGASAGFSDASAAASGVSVSRAVFVVRFGASAEAATDASGGQSCVFGPLGRVTGRTVCDVVASEVCVRCKACGASAATLAKREVAVGRVR